MRYDRDNEFRTNNRRSERYRDYGRDYRETPRYRPYESDEEEVEFDRHSRLGMAGLGYGYDGSDYYRYSPSSYSSERRRYAGKREHPTAWEKVKDFFGVGPKGYKRSDERIQEDVSDALMRDPAVDASQIEVRVSGGKVTLNGFVSSRWMRRRAEECVEGISGVEDVRNELDVRREFLSDDSSSSVSSPARSASGASSAERRKSDKKRLV